MTTALLERGEETGTEVLARTLGLTPPQRPMTSPLFRPIEVSPGDLPLDDPDWSRLDAYREEAWRRGITERELYRIDVGFCPTQVKSQIQDLRAWLGSHPA